MNPVQHANISVKRRGGELEDYIDIHALIDRDRKSTRLNSSH